MKNIITTIVIIVIIIVSTIMYIIFNNNETKNVARRKNVEYENYRNRTITGNEIATLINKAMNNNEENKVEKDNKGNYNNNNENSINIDIKFIDNDETYRMETIYNNGTDKFVEYYNTIQFKCMDIKYHEKTGQVSYMYIEQVST